MPRHADPRLEDRILTAAHKLWKRGAEKSLTMRAVAKAAGTNTPAVYRRFRDRQDILRALLEQIRMEMFQLLEAAPTPEEACERYLDFAISRPHDYELYYGHEYELRFAGRQRRSASVKQMFREKRPAAELMKRKLAERLGGVPDDYIRLTLALWAQVHGAALLLIAKNVLPEHAEEMRSVCRASVKALLRGGANLDPGSNLDPGTRQGI